MLPQPPPPPPPLLSCRIRRPPWHPQVALDLPHHPPPSVPLPLVCSRISSIIDRHRQLRVIDRPSPCSQLLRSKSCRIRQVGSFIQMTLMPTWRMWGRMWRRLSCVLEAPPDLVGLGRVGRRRVHEAPSSHNAVGGGGTAPPRPRPRLPTTTTTTTTMAGGGGEAPLGPQGSSIRGIVGSMRSA